MNDNQAKQKSAERRVIEAVLGLAFVLAAICMVFVFFPFTGNDRNSTLRSACLSNMKQLDIGMHMYASDFDGLTCPAMWMDPLHPYVKSWAPFACPQVRQLNDDLWSGKKPILSGYAMNVRAIGRPLAKTDPMFVLFFETDALAPDVVANVNAMGFRHLYHTRSTVAYADTHVKAIRVGQVLRGEP